MNSRGGGGAYSEFNGLTNSSFPIRITVDQYPQFRGLPYIIRTITPDLNQTPAESERREARRLARPSVMNSVSNLHSNPSPDEIVIKGRGRRSLPLKWSPIPIESPQKTPLSSLAKKSPKKGIIALRSSPRKRLQLTDSPATDLVQSRKSLLGSSPLARKSMELKKTHSAPCGGTSTDSELSRDKLAHVLLSFLDKTSQVQDESSTHLDTSDSTLKEPSCLEKCERSPDSPDTSSSIDLSSDCHDSYPKDESHQ